MLGSRRAQGRFRRGTGLAQAGVRLDVDCAHNGLSLGSGWAQAGLRLDSGWARAGLRLGSCWAQTGLRLDPGWVQVGLRLGLGWDQDRAPSALGVLWVNMRVAEVRIFFSIFFVEFFSKIFFWSPEIGPWAPNPLADLKKNFFQHVKRHFQTICKYMSRGKMLKNRL